MESPSLLDVQHFVNTVAFRSVERELDIAVEIFLAHQCTRIHYADLMDDVPAGLASKAMLLNWCAQDYTTRDSIITQYHSTYPHHFENGRWMARNFALFIRFAKQKLTDPKFVKSRAKADLFAKSFDNETWREKAAAVLGLKLLEAMYHRRALRSREATSLLSLNFTSRELLQKVGHAAGRIAKNNGLQARDGEPFRDIVEEHFKRTWRIELERAANSDELRMFEKFEKDIRKSLDEVFGITSQVRLLALPPSV